MLRRSLCLPAAVERARIVAFVIHSAPVTYGVAGFSSFNEARMMGTIRSSMEAIITMDERQNIVIFNPMAEHGFGCSAARALGGSLSRFIPEQFRAGHGRHVEQFGVTGVSERQMGNQQRVLFDLRSNGEELRELSANLQKVREEEKTRTSNGQGFALTVTFPSTAVQLQEMQT